MPLPGGITTIVLTGTYLSPAGDPVLVREGRPAQVTFTPNTAITDNGGKVIFTTRPIVALLNAAGQFSITLACTDNTGLNPHGWCWNVNEQIPELGREYSILLPSTLGETVDISDLSPVASVPPASSYILTSQVGEPSGVAELDSSGLIPEGELPDLSGTYLSLAGGTMAGPIGLPGNPTAALQAAPKQYVDAETTRAESAESVNASAITAETSRAEAAEALKAPLASPALTGSPTAPTASPLSDSTQVATTAYADGAVSAEKTRAEAAEALLAPLVSPALSGTPTAPTKTALTDSTAIATTAYADAAVAVETSRAETAEAAIPTTGTPLAVNRGGTGSGTQNWTGLLTPTTQTTTYTANPGDLVKANISSSSWTMKLPNAPANNTIVGAKVIVNATGNANTLTVQCQGSDVFEQSGGATTATLSLLSQAAAWQYNSGYWTRISDDLPLGQLDARYSEKAAAGNAVYYVSAASGASDSNDGLSWGSAFATLQQAVSALPAGGGRIVAGAGTYSTSSQLSLNGLTNVIIEAAGGRTGGAAAGTTLSYTGTAAAFITAQSTVGCQLRGLQIAYTNSGFTGNLVDARNVSSTDTAFFRMDNCLLAGSSISTAAALVALDKCNTSEIVNCAFTNAAVGITGRSSGGYSNGIRIAGNQFANLGMCAITSSGQAWVIEANTFEPLSSGAAGAYTYGSGQAGNGVTFTGNWFGDVTNGGIWITWNGNNLVVEGNYIAGDANTTGIAVTSNDNSGIDIRSNDFDILLKAVDLGSTTGQSNFAVMFNTYTSVTTTVNATTWPTGGIHYNGSALRVGNFQMTGAAAGSGAGVYFDAETSGDSAVSVRGGAGLHVVSSAGTEKLQLDAAVTLQHAANSILTSTTLPALIPGVILASNTITLTLGAPSNGYRSFIKNINTSSGNVTLSPSSGTIDGASSLVLSPLESVEIAGDGNNWWVLAQDLPLAAFPSASTSAKGIIELDGTGSDITALAAAGSSASAGSVGKAADSGHQHSSNLLAVHQYGPTTLTGYNSTSQTLAAMDTTNLTISFTAPASGNVLARLTGAIESTGSTLFVLWGLLDHTSGSLYGSLLEVGSPTTLDTRTSSQLITGLTPGTAYQMDWALGISASGTASFYVGSLASKTYANKAIPAVMEIWAT